MEFNAGNEIMRLCYKQDVESKGDIKFTEMLAYLAARNGNNFSLSKDKKNLDTYIKRIKAGEKHEDIVKDMKYYEHYYQRYNAVLGNFVGEYTQGETKGYGLKAYHPLARNFYANEYDDFGNRRSYGWSRPHTGHDFMGSVGTPVIAVEGGTVHELGWNRFGGWRIGILSHDKTRFYYYAHLRKGRPFAERLKQGDTVAAGQVIGYLGVTGYSTKEDKNMSCPPHLHFGMQILFDPSQYDSNNEIWIDVYQISKFLYQNRAEVVKNPETKEYKSINLKS